MLLNIIFIFTLFIITNGKKYCRTDNHCGSYGYCYETANITRCECKFWWIGEDCNIQSNDGKQVVILGSLTGFLVCLFYSLKIGRSIYDKFKKPKETKIEEIEQSSNFVRSTIKNIKKSTLISSSITTILTVLIATITLLIKWSLLKPIHNVMVDKYKKKEPIYFTPVSYCNIVGLVPIKLTTFPVAALLIIICIIVTKRVSLMRNKCYGYIAPPIPVDFFSHIDRKLAAVIFAITADDLLQIVGEIFGPSNKSAGILVRFLLRLLDVLIMSCRYFPILAAAYINSIFTLSCAMIYTWLDYIFIIIDESMCNPNYYPTEDEYFSDLENNSTLVKDILEYYGTGPNFIAIQLAINIPVYLCYAYISIKLLMMLIQKIREQKQRSLLDEKQMLVSVSREENVLLGISHPDSVDMLYVKNLFRYSTNSRPRTKSLFGRLIPKFIYEWRDDFRFSTRIICIYSSVFLLLYLVVFKLSVVFVPTLHTKTTDLQDAVSGIVLGIDLAIKAVSKNDDSLDRIPLDFKLPYLVKTYLCAVAMTVIILVIQLLALLANIRRNLLQIYRGDDCEIPRREPSKYVSYATGNIRFAGYFIGYFIWGCLILEVFSIVFCICIGAFIQYENVRPLEKILKFIIPGILLAVFKSYLNKLLVQYIFLYDYGKILAQNNRRILMIFIYFNFFLDAFLGLFSAIKRLVLSVFGTIFYMCRLDYASVGRKLEGLDAGFSSYCGLLHTECTHRHPIMLVFASHLLNELRRKQYALNYINFNDSTEQKKDTMLKPKASKYIRKWRLAVFLIQNPAIVIFRKSFLKQLLIEEQQRLMNINSDNQYDVQAMASYIRKISVQRLSFNLTHKPNEIMILKF